MTIILQNPDILNNTTNHADVSLENDTHNILDELEQEPNSNRQNNLSLLNVSSALNTSSRGLNTTLNFLKSKN